MMHEMKLNSSYYDFILNGTKRIEIRLNDPKRRKIKVGDTIRFFRLPFLREFFDAKVTSLFKYDSFDDIFKDFDISILADKSVTKEELVSVLDKFYTKEDQNLYGFLLIGIEL